MTTLTGAWSLIEARGYHRRIPGEEKQKRCETERLWIEVCLQLVIFCIYIIWSVSSKRIFNHPTIQFLFEEIAENDKMYPIPLSKANIIILAKVVIKVYKTRLMLSW